MTLDSLPRIQESPSRAPLAILCTFLLFEYLRIHDILPILNMLKLQTGISLALLTIVIMETARKGLSLPRQSRLLLGFLGLTVFTILQASNWYFAYQFSYNLMLTLIAYFAITHVIQNPQDLRRFLAVLVAIHIYLAFKVILGYNPEGFSEYGYQTGFEAGSNFLGDENDVALAMVLILPLGIYLFRVSRSLLGRLTWGIGSMAILLCIVFTYSRGGFLGLMGILLYSVLKGQNRRKAIVGIALAATLIIAVAPSSYWDRIKTLQQTDSGTALERKNFWTAGFRMFRDSPVWGVGGRNFGLLLPDYALDDSPDRRLTRWGRSAHSLYVQLLAEFGLIGLGLIASLLIQNFRDLRQIISTRRKGRCSASVGELAESLQQSWVGFLIPAAFLSVLEYPHMYFLTALTVVAHGLARVEQLPWGTKQVGSLEESG